MEEVNAAARNQRRPGGESRSITPPQQLQQLHQRQHQRKRQEETIMKGSASLRSLARPREAGATSETNAAPDCVADGEDRRGGGGEGPAARRTPAGGIMPNAPGRSPPPSEAVPAPWKKSLSAVSSSVSDATCADEMREVKLEAALLCGIGRGPPRRAMSTDAAAAAAADKVSVGDKRKAGQGSPRQRSLSSSPGTVRGGGALRHPNGGGAFPSPALAAAAHSTDNTRGGGTALPSMSQIPGSPSASGETDSDHSDSMVPGAGGDDAVAAGGGGGHKQMLQQPPHHQRSPVVSRSGLRGSGFTNVSGSAGRERGVWGGYPAGRAATAGGDGLSCA